MKTGLIVFVVLLGLVAAAGVAPSEWKVTEMRYSLVKEHEAGCTSPSLLYWAIFFELYEVGLKFISNLFRSRRREQKNTRTGIASRG